MFFAGARSEIVTAISAELSLLSPFVCTLQQFYFVEAFGLKLSTYFWNAYPDYVTVLPVHYNAQILI